MDALIRTESDAFGIKIHDVDNKINRVRHIVTTVIVILSALWAILPMLILRENYIFTIHDGMDSYAGLVQNIHDNGLFFHLNKAMPFMNGIQGKYTFITYNLYDFYNCIFGFVVGQILTRITGVVLGYISLKKLLTMLNDKDSCYKRDMISLISITYAVTPVAPNRAIGFAALPLIAILFIKLYRQERITKYIWVSLIIPVLSVFDAILVFTLGLWFLMIFVLLIVNKKINWNLVLSFLLQVVSTIIVNWNFFLVAINAEETNRKLYINERNAFSFDWGLMKEYLIDGQYHSTALQREYILNLLFLGTVYVLFKVYYKKEKIRRFHWILITGWIYWIFSALIGTLQESGFKTGILLIDGFQWGRTIGLMRIVWYIMLACILYTTYKNKIWRIYMYIAICSQILNVMTSSTMYSDTRDTLIAYRQILINGTSEYISYKEFFDNQLFDRIKADINYDMEGVAAYGFHPSVLINNSFNTIDGYESVHSMKWQLEFREIIAPRLDLNEIDEKYYDGWGGRMYLFGALCYNPTKNKPSSAFPLYIDTEAFKKYGGKYILSRARISNSDELGLVYVNDYDSEEGIYHIWLYEAK